MYLCPSTCTSHRAKDLKFKVYEIIITCCMYNVHFLYPFTYNWLDTIYLGKSIVYIKRPQIKAFKLKKNSFPGYRICLKQQHVGRMLAARRSVPCDHHLPSLGKPRDANRLLLGRIFFYPALTLMIDSYILSSLEIISLGKGCDCLYVCVLAFMIFL